MRMGTWRGLLAGTLLAARVFAHGDVHLRIEAMTVRIAAAPGDARLHFERGQLWAQDEAWSSALADFNKAEQLDAALPGLGLAIGGALYELGACTQALARLDPAVDADPESASTRLARARARRCAGDLAGAAADYGQLAAAPTPTPVYFAEWAEVLVQAGDPAGAIRALDAGLARLGPIPGLRERALALELKLGHTDAALQRLDGVIAGSTRPEYGLARKADILAGAARNAEARDTYLAAQRALAAAPPRARETAQAHDLETRITAGLADVTKASAP